MMLAASPLRSLLRSLLFPSGCAPAELPSCRFMDGHSKLLGDRWLLANNQLAT